MRSARYWMWLHNGLNANYSENSIIIYYQSNKDICLFNDVMGYSWVLSVRSIIEYLYIIALFLILVNREIDWNIFFGLRWYWCPRSCNLGINVIVDSKQVPFYLRFSSYSIHDMMIFTFAIYLVIWFIIIFFFTF